jgi:glutamate synthase domain-containing protein 3
VEKCSFREFNAAVDDILRLGSNGSMSRALSTLTLLNDMRYNCGNKKRSHVLCIVRSCINRMLDNAPLISNGKNGRSEYTRIDWANRDKLRAPGKNEKTLVIDSSGFPPEGDECDSMLSVKAAEMGWERFIVYNLKGQRFHGCGFGQGSDSIRMDLYGSSGDYAGSGMNGCRLYIHDDAQDQLGQILKRGKLVVYGNVGQTFLYGAKGGEIYVLGSAAGRPLINAVGKPRAVINGTCLDFLAESFMAGDPLNGGGFVILNGIEFDPDGNMHDLPLPYPGSNLFSLASGGALYIRDPKNTLIPQQLNGGTITDLSGEDWDLILPYLKENQKLFNIKISDLLKVDGNKTLPELVYRKIVPSRGTELREIAEGE